MADHKSWICSNCKSINSDRSGRCYSCRAPRTLALDLSATQPATSTREGSSPAQQAAVAHQAGEAYRSSAVRARVVLVTIALVVLVDLFASARIIEWTEEVLALQAVAANDGQVSNADWEALLQDLYPILALVAALVGAWVAGWICWGAWLSRVVSNVPALGGGWPATSSSAAFWTSIIPFYNVYGATSVLRDVIVRLSPQGQARTGLLTAWWLSLFLYVLPYIGLIPGPTFVIRLVYTAIVAWIDTALTTVTGSEINAAVIESAITFGVLLLAAILAGRVVWQVEALQSSRRGLAPQSSAVPSREG